MRKFTHVLIFVVNLNILFCFTMLKSMSESVKKEYVQFPDVTQIITNEIIKAKSGIENIKNLFGDFKNFKLGLSLGEASYLKSNLLKLQKEGTGELLFDFGYLGHGDLLKPFLGFSTKINIVDVPEWLNDAILKTLIKLGFDSFVNIKPKDEFLIKSILLFNDKKNKLIDSSEFITELFFLFYRLSQVKDFEGMKSLFSSKGFFSQIILNIKIGKKSLSDYFDEEWTNFKEVSTYDFAIESKPQLIAADLIEMNDWNRISKICAAIGLKTAIEYYVAREKLLKTDAGKNLDLKIIQALNLKEKILAQQNFTKSLPEYGIILSNTQKRTMGFLKRIKGVRNNWNLFVDKIRPVLSPFFDVIGLPFDLVVRKFDDLDDKSKSELDNSSVMIDPELGDISSMDVNQVDYMDF